MTLSHQGSYTKHLHSFFFSSTIDLALPCLAACTGSPRPKQCQHHQNKETGLQQHQSHLAYTKISMPTEEPWPLPHRFVHIWFTLKCQALTQSSSGDDTSHCLQRQQGLQAGQGRAGQVVGEHISYPSQTSLCRQDLRRTKNSRLELTSCKC